MDFGKQIVDALEGVPNEIKLPALADISSRLTDWIFAGGKHDDPYIKQQVNYAKRIGEKYRKEPTKCLKTQAT